VSAEASRERQTTLDSHIYSRIQAELQRLREEEEKVQKEIEHALEKENLDRERSMAGETLGDEGDGSGSVKSSAVLLGDLEEIQSKVDRYQQRRELNGLPSLKASGETVISCYRYVTICYLLCVYFWCIYNSEQKQPFQSSGMLARG
jgi:MICOS complex subunit MIC19